MKKLLSVLLAVIILAMSLSCAALALDNELTSTSYRYDNRFNTAQLFYNDLSLITEEYFAIPGLEITVISSEESCNCMTPQGLCVSDKYIFISAYCGVKRYVADLEENKDFGSNTEKLLSEENHKVHNSVIYVLDRETGAYLKTLVLPDANHVGGLATDGKNLFVAKSSDKMISVITSAQIELAMATESYTVKARYDLSIDCGCTASFVTYFDGILWVGVFNEKEKGELNGYTFNALSLEKIASIVIPEKANGASFCELDGEVCLNVNSSYGRKNFSKIYLYTVEDYGTENMKVTEKDTYTVPPTVQNSDIYDGKVYHIYESAATCYSQVESLFEIKSTTCPIDRICIGQAENLFNWHAENIFLSRISAFIRALKTATKNIF